MLQFWYALLDHLVFLHVAFPLLGALLVLWIGRSSQESARRMAVCNAGVTLLLTLVMTAAFETRPGTTRGLESSLQMESNFPWINGRPSRDWPADAAPAVMPDVRITFGVDGISLWMVALTSLLSFAIVATNAGTITHRRSTFLAGVLSLEAATIGVLTSLDVVVFAVCLNASLLVTTWLVARWGGAARRTAARRYLKANAAGNVLLMVGLAALVGEVQTMRSFSPEGAQATLSIPEMIDALPELILHHRATLTRWELVRSVIFVTLLLGIAVRLPLFPFHGWFLPVVRDAVPEVKALVCGTTGLLGIYCWVRLVVPIFPENCVSAVQFLSALSLLGIVYFSVSTLAAGELHVTAGYACLAHMNWAFLASLSFDAMGVGTALLYSCANGLCAALLFLTLPQSPRTPATSANAHRPGLALGGLALCAFLGMPGLAMFSTGVATALSVARWNLGTALWATLAALVATWGLVTRYQRTLRIEQQLQWTRPVPRRSLLARVLSGESRFAMVLLVVVNLSLGLVPRMFLDRVAPATATALREYRTSGTEAN